MYRTYSECMNASHAAARRSARINFSICALGLWTFAALSLSMLFYGYIGRDFANLGEALGYAIGFATLFTLAFGLLCLVACRRELY